MRSQQRHEYSAFTMGNGGFYEHGALSAIKTDCQAQLNKITWLDCLPSAGSCASCTAHGESAPKLTLHICDCIQISFGGIQVMFVENY